MRKLIDFVCPACGRIEEDQWDDEEVLCFCTRPPCTRGAIATTMEPRTWKNNTQRAFVNDARTVV